MNGDIREDETELWQGLVNGEAPRYAGVRLGMSRKRVEYLCEKWARQGKYDFGVVHDLGWVVGHPQANPQESLTGSFCGRGPCAKAGGHSGDCEM